MRSAPPPENNPLDPQTTDAPGHYFKNRCIHLHQRVSKFSPESRHLSELEGSGDSDVKVCDIVEVNAIPSLSLEKFVSVLSGRRSSPED